MLKKSLLLAAIAAGLMSMTALAESYAHLESVKGNVDILGVESFSNVSGDYVIVYGQYENTTSSSTSAGSEFILYVYQGGIELDSGYPALTASDVHETKDMYTKIRPGATVQFYTSYKLPNTTDPVDIEIYPLGYRDMVVECTLSMNSELEAASDNQYTPGDLTEAAPNPYEERIAALEALVADLTARIEALEAK